MRNQAGFSLMELMAVVGILSIIIAIAAPNALTWLDNAKTSSATRQVLSVIQDARMHSIKENSMTTLDFSAGTDKFVTRKLDRKTGDWKSQTHKLPGGMKLSATFSGKKLTYDSKGFPRTMFGGRVKITNKSGTTFNVIVNSTGNARIERESS